AGRVVFGRRHGASALPQHSVAVYEAGREGRMRSGLLAFQERAGAPSAGAQHGSDQVLAPGPLGSGQGNSQPVFSQLSRAIQKRPLARSTGGIAEYREHASNETDRAGIDRHADPNSTRD